MIVKDVLDRRFPAQALAWMVGVRALPKYVTPSLTPFYLQLALPVKLVVFNNSALGFVELKMKAAGLLDYGTDLVNPHFAQLAESAEMFGVRVEKPEELRPALTRALAHDGPALVKALVNRQELSMPPAITLDQALGFILYMIRTVLSGRGDEVIDLARTNLFR